MPSTALAAAASVWLPPVAPVRAVVVLVKSPGTALAGTFNATCMVQDPPAAIVPSVSVMIDVPLTSEPAPHASAMGVLDAVMPGTNASRSSEKVRPAAALAGSGLVITKIALVVPPVGTSAGSKDLANPSGSTTRSALSGSA